MPKPVKAVIKPCHSPYPDHSKQLNRISRIQGQLNGVKKMIEEMRYCPDILTQTKAVRSALAALEGEILRAHLESCVKEAFEKKGKASQSKKIEEIVDLFKAR